jgi:nicotinamidase-related amidase
MRRLRAQELTNPFGPRTAVLVIDEENPNPDGLLVSNQRRVLDLARTYEWPVLFVQYWTELPAFGARPKPEVWAQCHEKMNFPCRNHIGNGLWFDGAQLLTKVCKTAFGPPVILGEAGDPATWIDLHAWLQGRGVRRLVVLGNQVNACVKGTVIDELVALDWFPRVLEPGKVIEPALIPGAARRGYTVLTCHEIVWSGEADWTNEPGVEFYDRLGP